MDCVNATPSILKGNRSVLKVRGGVHGRLSGGVGGRVSGGVHERVRLDVVMR